MMPQFPGLNAHDTLPGVTGIHQLTPDPEHHQQRGSATPLSSSMPAFQGNSNNGATLPPSSAVSPDIPMQHGAGSGLSNEIDAHSQQQLHAQQIQQLHSLNHPASPLNNSSSSSSTHPHDVHSLAHHHVLADAAASAAAPITANVTTEAVPAEVTPSEVMSSVRGVDSLRNNNGNPLVINNDDDDDDERRAAAVAALLAQRSPFGPPRALSLVSTAAPTSSSAASSSSSLHHNHQLVTSAILPPLPSMASSSSSSSSNDAVAIHNAIHNAGLDSLGNHSHQQLHHGSQIHGHASSGASVAGPAPGSGSVNNAVFPSRNDHSPITPTEGSQTPFITPEGGNIALNRLPASAHESDAMMIDSMPFNAIRVQKESDDQGGTHLTSTEEEVDHNSMDTD